MAMRGATRRGGEPRRVALRDFGWDAAEVATLRHCSLPWYDSSEVEIELTGSPLSAMRDSGARDRLSLTAQFAAHQAFLQFAGITDGEFQESDWIVVRRRGCDCRLVRVRAARCDADDAPPLLTLIQGFADCVDAPRLDVLRRSWARPESVYAEIEAKLGDDAAADLRWMRRAAAGEVLSPGDQQLRSLFHTPPATHGYGDPQCVASLDSYGRISGAAVLIVGCDFPIHRYAALRGMAEAGASESDVAERLAIRLGEKPSVIVVRAAQFVDDATRRVIHILSGLHVATILLPEDGGTFDRTRRLVLSTSLSARTRLEERISAAADPAAWIGDFVASPAYRAYLARGEVPADDSAFAAVPEPRRSYLAALSLLGTTLPRSAAVRFLRDFLFDQPLEELSVPGVTVLDESSLRFVSEAMRAHCERSVPAASRMTLCRAAAAVAEPARAAFLLIEGGEVARGLALLEEMTWLSPEETVATLSALPRPMLTPLLAWNLANALVDCGRYRDAGELAPALTAEDRDLLLARAERRTGDYEGALARLERHTALPFEAEVMRGELLRVSGRTDEARHVLNAAAPVTDEERVRLTYEKAVIALESGERVTPDWPVADHYFISRFETYRALHEGAFDAAEQFAARSEKVARCATERIDALLDRVFSTFSAGAWKTTRALALEALAVIDEAQGDRAAAGILFTLSYLAADDGQWTTAAHSIARLRSYYAEDALRLFETDLLAAHLAFCRAEFGEARRLAGAALSRPGLHAPIREAAALILDELDWIEGRLATLRSTGRVANRELNARHHLMRSRRGEDVAIADPFTAAVAAWERSAAPLPTAESRSEKLKLLRSALGSGDRGLAGSLARDLGIDLQRAVPRPAPDLDILRIAAAAEYPFRDDAFGDARWCFAACNRLGHWQVGGSHLADGATLDRIAAEGDDDWIVCSDRELLYFQRCRDWPEASRQALAGIFHTRAENHRLRRLIDAEPSDAAVSSGYHGMVGESAVIRSLFETVDRVAKRDVPVCILGESGTGKELVARAIHRASSRRQKVFTPVNCAALPENLIESELFGHVRGAFTGADRDRAGLIETSDGGTLFLDEIGEMALPAQAKLLRFLQEGEFRRVGDIATRTADVRIVAATNRKPEAAVEEGRFREDLYYRIRGVEIALPALRERGNDVVLLARHFLSAEREKHRSGPTSFANEVEAVFRTYRWPGNVRELQNTIRAAHAMAGEAREIDLHHLPERLQGVIPVKMPMAGSYQDAVARFRRELIEKSLLEAAGNQNRAAALLNMSRQALAYQIRELGIMVQKPGGSRRARATT
jgi:DNA-binding NtrC family response regulator